MTGTQTQVGSSANVPSNARILDAAGNDVTAGYAITYKNGTLTVTERSQYTLTIRYWRNGEIISTVTLVQANGSAYDVATPPLAGYTVNLERVQGYLTADAEYDVYYTPVEHRLTIQYLYQNGETAAATHTEMRRYGERYSIDSPVIGGFYTANQQVSGTMPDRDVTITVIYIANERVITIDDFETPLGIGLGGINTGETIE